MSTCNEKIWNGCYEKNVIFNFVRYIEATGRNGKDDQ